MKKCPKCNRKYIDFDLFCSSCNVNLVYDEPNAAPATVVSAPVVKASAPVNPVPVKPAPVTPAPVNPAPVNNTAAPEKKKGLLWWQILIIVAVSVILLIAIVISAVTIIDNLDESDGYQQYDDDDDEDKDDDDDDKDGDEDKDDGVEDGEDAGDDNNDVNGGYVENPVIDNTGNSEFTTNATITTPNVENTTSYNPNSGSSGNSGTVNSSDYSVILSKYTSVMNQLKSGVSSYDKVEWQELGDDYNLGSVGAAIMGIAEGLMTNRDEAPIQNRNDMEQIPIVRNSKGCLLTDTSKIKSASMTQSGSKTTITIVLKDEQNPYPAEEGATYCGSAVGSMFNPLNQAEVDNIVAQFSGVMTINKFLITAKDCTATLVFDTATGKVESLTQVMNYYIDLDAKVVVVPLSGYATITDTIIIDNITY